MDLWSTNRHKQNIYMLDCSYWLATNITGRSLGTNCSLLFYDSYSARDYVPNSQSSGTRKPILSQARIDHMHLFRSTALSS